MGYRLKRLGLWLAVLCLVVFAFQQPQRFANLLRSAIALPTQAVAAVVTVLTEVTEDGQGDGPAR